MRRTTVAPVVRAARVARSAPTCPVLTWTEVDTPRWVTGMPASAGTEKAEVMPGTTETSTPARRQAWTSSPPRPKTYGSPPLRRTTAQAPEGAVDEDRVDLGLRHGVVRRALADVDDLDVGRQPVEQCRRAEPVGDDDVGRGQGLEPGERDEPGVARTAPDEGHAPASGTASAQVDLARGHVEREGVAHAGRPARVGVSHRDDAEDEVAVGARGDASAPCRPGRRRR